MEISSRQYDLLSNSQPGINYPETHIGAFVAQDWPPGVVNDEDQAYVPEAATQVCCEKRSFYFFSTGIYCAGGLYIHIYERGFEAGRIKFLCLMMRLAIFENVLPCFLSGAG